MPKFFDIHSHIDDKQFKTDIIDVIDRMSMNDVWTIVVGTDKNSSQNVMQISNSHKNIFACIGIHPTDKSDENFDHDYFLDLAQSENVVAIGECGLDYFRAIDGSGAEKKRQKNLFEKQLELAVKVNKPLMIHCRDAHEDMLSMLTSKKKEYGKRLRGNIHFFAGGVATAKKYFSLDFTISFTGVITFTSDYDEVIKYASLDKIMSETDSPYVAPVPFRGKRNEPIYVKEVVKRIAQVRREDYKVVQDAMVDNAIRVFAIKNS